MQTSLLGIARKAKQNRNYKFGNLYGLLNKEALYQAWKDINKKAAVGIDKETAKEFGNNLDEKLEELVEEFKSKRYKARLVKRVNIPKGNGKRRPLGLQTLRGKIALGIYVTDMDGNRISFGKATGRYFGKIVSALILYIGFMLAGWTEKKQAFHDMMGGCLVVSKHR